MPVNNVQRGRAEEAIQNIHSGVGSERIYRQVMGVTPKGFRASILKLVDWPTSWGFLYGLSPAQISQNREAEVARATWEMTGTSYAGGENKTRMWLSLLGSYFLGNSDPVSQSDFPRWRKPSWMTDDEKRRVDDFISRAYEMADRGQMPNTTRESAQPEPEPAPQPAAEPAPQSTSRDASEPSSRSQNPMSNADRGPVTGRQLSDSLYSLYGHYFRGVYGIESDDQFYRNRFNGSVKRAIQCVLTLEALGYEYRGIKAFLDSMRDYGQKLYSFRPNQSSSYGPYVLVDLQGTSNATRYQSRKAYDIMSRTCRTDVALLKAQFEPSITESSRRRLQVFRFSGRGAGMGGFQILSLRYVNTQEFPDRTAQEGRELLREAKARAELRFNSMGDGSELGSASESQSNDEVYEFAGFSAAAEGMTYQQDSQFNISLNKFPTAGRFSYVFYFTKKDSDGNYDIFRSVFGPLDATSRISDQPNSGARLAQLKVQMNLSGRLNTQDVLMLQKVPVLDKRKFRAAFVRQELEGLTSSSIPFSVTRSQELGEPVNFSEIYAPSIIGISAMANKFREMGTEAAEPGAVSSDLRISDSDLKAIGQAEMADTNNVGFEFEGGHPSKGMSSLARAFNSAGISMNAESYNHTTRPRWKLVPDASLSGVPNAFELVSPILTGQAGLQNLRDCLKAAEEVGCEIYKEGGVHIHFDYSNWDLQTKKNILINQYLMSPWLQATQPKHRRDNRWAVRFKTLVGTYEDWKRRVLEVNGEYGLTRLVRGNRYHEINITNTRQPTWEWRFPQGNIEQDTNINMVRVLDKLIEVSKKGLLSSNDVTEEGMKKWMGTDLFTFWRNRIYDLSMTGGSRTPSYNHRSII